MECTFVNFSKRWESGFADNLFEEIRRLLEFNGEESVEDMECVSALVVFVTMAEESDNGLLSLCV